MKLIEIIGDRDLAYDIFSGKRFYFDVPDLYEKVYDYYYAFLPTNWTGMEPVTYIAELIDKDLRVFFDNLPKLKDFERRLKYHDWYYEYSDDHSVWRTGVNEQNEIRQLMEELKKVDMGDEARGLYDYYCPWILKGDPVRYL